MSLCFVFPGFEKTARKMIFFNGNLSLFLSFSSLSLSLYLTNRRLEAHQLVEPLLQSGRELQEAQGMA